MPVWNNPCGRCSRRAAQGGPGRAGGSRGSRAGRLPRGPPGGARRGAGAAVTGVQRRARQGARPPAPAAGAPSATRGHTLSNPKHAERRPRAGARGARTCAWRSRRSGAWRPKACRPARCARPTCARISWSSWTTRARCWPAARTVRATPPPAPAPPLCPGFILQTRFTLYFLGKALLAITARPRVLPWMGRSLAHDGGSGRPRQRPSWRWRRCGTACAWSRAWPRRSWRARARPRCRCRAAVSCSTWPPPGPRRAPPAVRALSSGRPGLPARGRGA